MSDIRWSYSRSLVLAELLDPRGVKHVFIRSGCPWRNGKWNGLTGSCKPSGPTGSPSEAIKNTLTCLPPWLRHYNNERNHIALGGHISISRLLPT